MVNRLNLYQLIFAALFILKIGDVGKFEHFSWLWILAPLVAGTIHGYIYKLMVIMGIPQGATEATLEIYLESVRKKATKRAIEDMKKGAK